MKAVNWNRPEDDFTIAFWQQNIMRFWTDDEIPLSDDKMSWLELSKAEQEVHMKVLAGLTLLDTVQGGWACRTSWSTWTGFSAKLCFLSWA